MPADCRAWHPTVVALVYFMHRECYERWPSVEAVVAQLGRDYRFTDSRARQVTDRPLAELDAPFSLHASDDTCLVTIDPSAHVGLNEDLIVDEIAFDNTHYPPEGSQ